MNEKAVQYQKKRKKKFRLNHFLKLVETNIVQQLTSLLTLNNT